jgi:hypothetical protein
MAKKFLIKIDDSIEILMQNSNKLSYQLYNEIESICYPITNDISYTIADLIRDNRNKTYWELKITRDDEMFMVLNEPRKELKPSIFKILKQNNAIHITTSEHDNCATVA